MDQGMLLRSARELRGDGARRVYIHEIICQESEAFIGGGKRGMKWLRCRIGGELDLRTTRVAEREG
jgi:hypothetical protein